MLHIFRGLIVVASYAISAAVGMAQEPDNQDTRRVTQRSQTNALPAPATAAGGPADLAPADLQPAWGVTLDYVPASLRSHISALMSSEGGVLVRGVDDGSPARNAGIQPTDVLLKFNDRFVTSPRQFESWMADNGSFPAQLQILQAGEQKQVTIVPESGNPNRVTQMQSRSGSRSRNSADQAAAGDFGADWERLLNGGSTVFAFGGQTENGTVSLQGSGDGMTLNADYRDRRGKRRQLRMQGRPTDVDANLGHLPGDLRDLIRNQMSGQEPWDKWFNDDMPLSENFPF